MNNSFYIAKMWHEILMNSSTKREVEKYPELMQCSPIEMQIIIMTGSTSDLLLKEYVSNLHIPKSTLTSIISRLEKQQFIKRVISEKDLRSYSLVLQERGEIFFKKYLAYQKDIGDRILQGLDAKEQQQLITLLTKISTYMIGDK